MPAYIDGFLLSVPKKKLDAYRAMATRASKVWRDHGALEYRECVAEDMNAHGMTPFPKAARAKPGEVVVFSWIVYKSRAHRDRVNAKVMKDPRLVADMNAKDMPFDVKRMAYGGFSVFVSR